MQFFYVLRVLSRRWLVIALAIVALAIALATVHASLKTSMAIASGKPRGTHFTGNPVSLFQYSKDSRIHFFLSPYQIRQLELDLDGSGEVIGASGTREVTWRANDSSMPIYADLVSSNFFTALKIEFVHGSANSFANNSNAVVLSERFMQKHGIRAEQSSIVLDGKPLQIVGMVRDFTGLFDRETHVWIHWSQADGMFFPPAKSGKKMPVENEPQAWFAWALAIPAQAQQKKFDTLLAGLVENAAHIEPPFTQLIAIPGITNQTSLRKEADKSRLLYSSVSFMLLAIAALAMALTVALVRLSRLSDEWTMLRLGAPRRIWIWLPIVYGLLPLLLSILFAAFLSVWIDRLLLMDPSIAALSVYAADVKMESQWRSIAILIGCIAGLCVAFNYLVLRSAGITFGAARLQSQSGRLDKLFHLFNGAIAAAAILTLIISSLAAFESANKSSKIGAAAVDNVWFQNFSSRPGDNSVSATDRKQLQAMLHAEFPSIKRSGFMAVTPLSGVNIPLSEYEIGNNKVKFMVNESTPDALAALQLRLMAGRVFDENASHELVVDEDAAKQIQKAIAPHPVLGARLQDELGDILSIVGIVENIPYTKDLSQAPAIAYQAMAIDQNRLRLIIQGQLSEQDIVRLNQRVQDGSFKIKAETPESFSAIASKLRKSYQARALLTILSSICALTVAVFLLVSASLLRAKRHYKNYAIRMALGAPDKAILSHFLKGELRSNAIGGIIGIGVLLLLKVPESVGLVAPVSNQLWVSALTLLVFFLTTLFVLFFAVRPKLSSSALLSQIQCDSE